METFRFWLEDRDEHLPAGAIKVRLPHVEQQTNYSCGAAALRAVATYFKAEIGSEDELIDQLGTSEQDGTRPQALVQGARRMGLRAVVRDQMSIRDLKTLVDQGIPTIVVMQAYGDKKHYWSNNVNGHYVVIVGHAKGRIYFVDPMMQGGFHAYLPEKEFLTRWHDFDADGNRCHRLGVVIWSVKGKRPDWSERGALKMP